MQEAALIQAKALAEGVERFLENQQKFWADGRRGETARRAPGGFSETETSILRALVARGFLHYDNDVTGALQRHTCNIRSKIAKLYGPHVGDTKTGWIITVVGEGYKLNDAHAKDSKAALTMLLLGHGLMPAPTTAVPPIALPAPRKRRQPQDNPFIATFRKSRTVHSAAMRKLPSIFADIKAAVLNEKMA